MLPILVIWLGIALSFRDPYAFIPVLVILFTLLRLATRPARVNRPGPTSGTGTTTRGRVTGPGGTPTEAIRPGQAFPAAPRARRQAEIGLTAAHGLGPRMPAESVR